MCKPIVAIMYDFDKTLCTKDMQEYSFIPSVNMESSSFWNEVSKVAKEENMERILAYMYYMLKKARSENVPIRKHDFMDAGKNIELFPEVKSYFDKINAYADSIGVTLEHYIISSGLKEIIEGCDICKCFKKIYACEYHYDVNGVADFPALVVNYTSKTQFLFRINKGVLDISEDDALNDYVLKEERRVPFRNMIYIGDGYTDIPCMKLVKEHGGVSIAVYTQKKKVEKLLHDGRVNYIFEADYSEDKELFKTIKTAITHMKIKDELERKTLKQKRETC